MDLTTVLYSQIDVFIQFIACPTHHIGIDFHQALEIEWYFKTVFYSIELR